MSALEDRLRRDLRAESGQITPDSLPDLRLPGQTAHLAGRPWHAAPGQAGPWRRGPRAGGGPPGALPPWLAWAKPLAAAAAVIVVIAGALALSRVIQGQPPVAAGHPAGLRQRSRVLRLRGPGGHLRLRLARHPVRLRGAGPLPQGPGHQHREAGGHGQPAQAVQRFQRADRRGQRTRLRLRGQALLGAQRGAVAQAGGAGPADADGVPAAAHHRGGARAAVHAVPARDADPAAGSPASRSPRMAPGSRWPSPAGRVRSCRSSRSVPARSAPGSSPGPRGAPRWRGRGPGAGTGAP